MTIYPRTSHKRQKTHHMFVHREYRLSLGGDLHQRCVTRGHRGEPKGNSCRSKPDDSPSSMKHPAKERRRCRRGVAPRVACEHHYGHSVLTDVQRGEALDKEEQKCGEHQNIVTPEVASSSASTKSQACDIDVCRVYHSDIREEVLRTINKSSIVPTENAWENNGAKHEGDPQRVYMYAHACNGRPDHSAQKTGQSKRYPARQL